MAQQRLPIVNSDDGTWGEILRQYLMKEHFNDDTDNPLNGGHQNITVKAGTTSAAPITLASGSLLSTPAIGSIEFNGDKLYFTQTTGTTRKTVAIYDDASGATGDVYYRNSGGHFTRLGIGSTNDVLTVSGGVPVWQAPSAGSTTFSDSAFTIRNNTDNTKQYKFDVSNIGTGTTRTLIMPNANTTMVGTDVAQTLTNKRINPRVISIASTATPAIDTDAYDVAVITGLAVNITSFTMSGTPVEGQRLQISITGTAARTIAWGTSFEASTIPLPTTTVTTARLDTYFIWNSTTSKWRVADETPAGVYRSGGTDVSVADGGTGRSTSTTAYGIIAAGTTATGAQQTIAPGNSGQFLKSAGASALGSFANITSADISGLLMKSVRVADVGSETYTISAGSVTQINGTTIDGVTLAIGDRVLIACAPAASGTGSNLSNQPGNGIYTVTANTTNLTLARATDASGTETPIGVTVYIREGTNSAGYFVACSSPTTGAFTWGTTASQWGRAYPTIATVQTSAFSLTNKTIALGSNTITGTTAQFNTALTDGDFATLAGSETLTNKTLTNPRIGQILDSSGNVMLSTTPIASAVNYLQLSNGDAVSSPNPGIAAVGSNTDISVILTPKGSGHGVHIWEGSGQTTAKIGTNGTASNIDIDIIPKGTGVVKANNNPVISSVTGIPAVTGTPSSSNFLRGDGTWASPSGSGDVSSNTSTSVDGEVVLFNSTTGKSIKRATITGLAKLTSGVLSAATAGTDYVTPTGSETLTNKAINGASNSVSNVTGYLAAARVVSDGSSTSYTISSGTVTQITGTTVAGVSLAIGDRVLILNAPASTGTSGSNSTTQPGNGLYIVTGNTTNLTVSRAPEMSGTVSPWGMNIPVREGSNGWGNYVVFFNGSGAFTWGTTALAYYSYYNTGYYVDVPVDAARTQTLTNKTLTNPKINRIDGPFGSYVQTYTEVASAVNYTSVTNSATGVAPAISAISQVDTNVDLNLQGQGSGVVKANGAQVATTTDLANSARLVVSTQSGSTTTADGANTWAKLATFSTGTNTFVVCTLILNVAVGNGWALDDATISVLFRSNATSASPTVDVSIMSLGGSTVHIAPDSFKVISGGWGTDMELWIRKADEWGQFNVYEVAKSITGVGTLTYSSNPGWQSATPTGAVNNVSSNGVTAFGIPVATTTATQTLTNKRVNPRVVTPSITTSYTIDIDSTDLYNVSGQSSSVTFNNPTGTPVNGQKLMVRIKDNGTTRTVGWGSNFQASGITAPIAQTIANKEHNVLFVYSTGVNKWVCLAADTVGY